MTISQDGIRVGGIMIREQKITLKSPRKSDFPFFQDLNITLFIVPNNQISLHFSVPNNQNSLRFEVPDNQISLYLGVPDNCSLNLFSQPALVPIEQLSGTPKFSEIWLLWTPKWSEIWLKWKLHFLGPLKYLFSCFPHFPTIPMPTGLMVNV